VVVVVVVVVGGSPCFEWVSYALVLSVKKGSLDRLFAPNYILGLPVSDS